MFMIYFANSEKNMVTAPGYIPVPGSYQQRLIKLRHSLTESGDSYHTHAAVTGKTQLITMPEGALGGELRV